ncbi:MAG TPA: DUF4416 domain-containing protein [Petrotoga sp.]|nr:MAG: Uncharacterized protein XD53_1764 [Petrotoga mobilis]HBT51184.1 DUF4416 domain-containing protein [Petrotoga sp.]
MGMTKAPDLVNYLAHIFTAGDSDLWLYKMGLKELIEKHFGPIDYFSPVLDFQRFTDYYNEEMGKNIRIESRLVSFKYLSSPGFLPDAKLITNEIEKNFSVDSKRKVNIDIGYLHHTQFVLASTKHWGNRIYIGKGIYAEITLMFNFGQWEPLKYTYPNFKDPEYLNELGAIRNIYLKKRKNFIL